MSSSGTKIQNMKEEFILMVHKEEDMEEISKTTQPLLFDVILCDAPWRYDFVQSNSRAIENQYPTMTTAEICALTVPAAKDCIMYFWATAPKLTDAFLVIDAWGFKYKTHAVWDKGKIGMGYWFRGQHELLMVATKGKVSPPEQTKRISSVMRYVRGKHSKKPDEIRDLIASWYPNASKLEMFARVATPGWSVFGNQVENSVDIK